MSMRIWSLFTFFFFLLHFGHSFSSLLLCSLPSSWMCACPRSWCWSSCMCGSPFSASWELHLLLHLLSTISMHIIPLTVRLAQTLFLKCKPAHLTSPTICFESPLIQTYQELNLFSLHIFLPPLATSILSVNQAQNLGSPLLPHSLSLSTFEPVPKVICIWLVHLLVCFCNYVTIPVDLSRLHWSRYFLSPCSIIHAMHMISSCLKVQLQLSYSSDKIPSMTSQLLHYI